MKKTLHIILLLLPLLVSAEISEKERINKIYDVEVEQGLKASKNLSKDKELMWKTTSSKNGKFDVAPVSAINASRRVIESVKGQLIGKNLDEVRVLIGFKKREKYGYHGLFHPIKKHAFVYRFDCGSFGWQYNFYLNDKKIVEEVEIKWIH